MKLVLSFEMRWCGASTLLRSSLPSAIAVLDKLPQKNGSRETREIPLFSSWNEIRANRGGGTKEKNLMGEVGPTGNALSRASAAHENLLGFASWATNDVGRPGAFVTIFE